MKILIDLDTDTAAFNESVSAELASILRGVADAVVMADLNEPFDRQYTIRDSDGKPVGKFRATAPTNHAIKSLR